MGYGDIDGDRPAALELDRIDAVLFDLDGVITDTTSLHAAAWKHVFDDVLRAWAKREGAQQRPFDTDEDYRRYFDGRPRVDGAEAFLSSRASRSRVGNRTNRAIEKQRGALATARTWIFCGGSAKVAWRRSRPPSP